MNLLRRKLARAAEVYKARGLRGVWLDSKRLAIRYREQRRYQTWIRKYGTLDALQRKAIRSRIDELERTPLISIILPVYNVDEKWLRQCVGSVVSQLYENWELCVADDCSTEKYIRPFLEHCAATDERIKVVFRSQNGHISAASNSALELANGEFAVLLDHDDELAEDALFWVANELNAFPECDMIYSDEDVIDADGRRYAPKFKPDWSRDLFYSVNLVNHLCAYRTEIIKKIGGFRTGFEGSQDYDLALRFIEVIPESHIRHIPRILYHWRAIRGSVTYSSDEKPYAHERAREAIRCHFERTKKDAEVVATIYNLHRVRYALPEKLPRVGLIVHGRQDLGSLNGHAKRLIELTDYDNLENIVASKDGPEDALVQHLNAAVNRNDFDILCFIEASLEPLSTEWLNEMVRFAYHKKIGAVGAKLLRRDGSVLHTGFILGAGDIIANANYGLRRNEPGNIFRNLVISNLSAVSISCLVIKRELFSNFGGFDQDNFSNRFFDVDFCLKLQEAGHRIVVTPYAELMKTDKAHLNFETEPTTDEREYLTGKWEKYLERDPFYNPNLSKKDGSFSIHV